MSHRRGFTLLELTVVLVLTALVCGAAVVSIRSPVRTAALQRDVAEFVRMDERLRAEAERTGTPRHLILDFDLRELRAMGREEDDIFEVRSCRSLTEAVVDGRSTNSGTVKLQYNSFGHSPAYSVGLMSGDEARWMRFSALTGFLQLTDGEPAHDATR